MADPTTTLGIPYPVGTDLVSQGPAEMQALATQVDLLLRQTPLNPAQTTVNYAASSGDQVICEGSGPVTISLPTPSIASVVQVTNQTSGIVTVTTGTGVISGAGMSSASVTLRFQGASLLLCGSGSNWLSVSGVPLPFMPLNTVAVTGTTYGANPGDLVLCENTATLTVTLPTPTTGVQVQIVAESSGLVVVNGAAMYGLGIGGVTSLVLRSLGMSVTLVGEGGVRWRIVGGMQVGNVVGTTANYTAVAGDIVSCQNSSPIAVTLTGSPGVGALVTVTNDGSSTVTISSGSINLVGPGLVGAATLVNTLGASLTFVYNGSTWAVIGGLQDSGWLTPTLSGGFVTGSPPVQYRLEGNTIRFRGGLATLGTSGATMFTLPVGSQPPQQVIVGSTGSGGTSIVISSAGASPAGAVKYFYGTQAISPDTVTFTVD